MTKQLLMLKQEKINYNPPYLDKIDNRERAIPSWAEDLFNENNKLKDVDTDDMLYRNYNKLLSPEAKKKYIIDADKELTNRLGDRKSQMSKDVYLSMAKNLAIEMYELYSQEVNEETEKDNYPDQMGKKFKPKNQFPKKKKKPQSVVKLSEEDELEGDEDIEQTIFDKEETGNEIEGGLADDKEISDFCPKQLAMGLEVEMEHTDDPKVALEITMDHLTEIPDYYTHLDNMEAEAGVKGETDESKMDGSGKGMKFNKGRGCDNNNDLETDELLGYKPHNVNDYANEEFDYAAAEREYSDKENYDVNSDSKVNDIPEEFEFEFQSIVDKFGEHVVNYLFNNGLRGYYETRVRGNYSLDDVEQSLNMLNVGGSTGGNEMNIAEEEDEYTGDVGDRYQDANNNQLTVRDKVEGGVTLQGQEGDREISTQDIPLLKKLGEETINEEQLKTAKLVLKDRNFSTEMTKKEAVQILIKHNIR
jgi:hypothetical protein